MSRAPAGELSLPSRMTRSFELAGTTLIAWAFGACSAAALGVLAFRLSNGDLKEANPLHLAPAVFGAGAEGARPWGLEFVGMKGAMLALSEGLAVLIALAMSMMFASGPRRLGLLLMVAWSGLWSADAVMILARSWNHGWWHVSFQFLGATLALFVITAAMAHRVSRLWRIPISI